MKANPEIIMVDKLNGKDFKLGEYELDDETGALYVGTHGTVFPGGSATTGGGGGSSSESSGTGGILDGFQDGIGCDINIRLFVRFMSEVQAKLDLNVEVDTDKTFKILPVYNENVLADLVNSYSVGTELIFS